jgi:secreted trypsin-like serine protease
LGKYERIIGGDNATVITYPFMASFRYIFDDSIFCAGAIISIKHILTAAHCLLYSGNNYDHVRIYTGVTRTHSGAGEVHKIVYVFTHPWFTGDVSENGINEHDIAIVLVRHL